MHNILEENSEPDASPPGFCQSLSEELLALMRSPGMPSRRMGDIPSQPAERLNQHHLLRLSLHPQRSGGGGTGC